MGWASAFAVIRSPAFASVLMLGWTAVVLGLFALFVHVQWRTFRWLRRADSVDPDALPVDFDELLRLAGVRSTVRVVRSPRVSAPAKACGSPRTVLAAVRSGTKVG